MSYSPSMDKLLDFTQPFDVKLFDAIVNTMFTGPPQQVVKERKREKEKEREREREKEGEREEKEDNAIL